MPFLIENEQGNNNKKNAFDIILSFINFNMQNMHCIDKVNSDSNEEFSNNKNDFYHICSNEINKCNLDPKSLQSCKRLLKAISILDDKVGSFRCQLNNHNQYVNHTMKQSINDNIDNDNKLLSFIPNIPEDDIKRFDIQMLVSETNQHATIIDNQLSNIIKYIKNKHKEKDREKVKVITKDQFNLKRIDMDSQENEPNSNDSNSNHINKDNAKETYLKNELSRLKEENRSLKIELRFIYEQLQIDNKIYVLNNSNNMSIHNSNNDYPFNSLSSSDICIKLNDNNKETTWITLKNYINKLKNSEFNI